MSSLTYWRLQVYDASSWIQTFDMPNPGNSAVDYAPLVSNSEKIKLWDGSKAFVTPTTKYEYSEMSWEITEASSTWDIYLQLADYLKNHRKITITDHQSHTVTGYFTNVTPKYSLSGSEQLYIISCNFEPI